jgi:hypothetical protein
MKKVTILLALIAILFVSCKKNPFDIDVSNVNIDLKIIRFDREFCSINPDSIYKYLPKWEQYGEFWNIYSQPILGLGNPEEYTFIQRTESFFDYCYQYQIYNDVQKVFPPNDNFLQNTLTDAFKHYKFYFPNCQVPVIFTTITGFNVSVFTGNGFIGISLDKYLGKDYALYPNLGFEKYQRRRMVKQMLPVDVMRAWAVSEFPYNDSVNNLMANMIYEGRIQYFLDAMLPDYPDTLKWGYTEMQWKWVNKFEKKIWDYLVERNLLFSQRTLDIKTFRGCTVYNTFPSQFCTKDRYFYRL